MRKAIVRLGSDSTKLKVSIMRPLLGGSRPNRHWSQPRAVIQTLTDGAAAGSGFHVPSCYKLRIAAPLPAV